jgi:hypothetical protein
MEEEFGDGFAIAARQAGVPLPVGAPHATALPGNPAMNGAAR